MPPGTIGDQSARNVSIQKITQADFDAMSPSRQAFFLERINKGQVKIVSASEIAAASQTTKNDMREKPSEKKRGPIDRLRGKSVKIHLVDGRDLTGTLTETWQYEVILSTATGAPVILKHAIISVEEDKNPEQGPVPAAREA